MFKKFIEMMTDSKWAGERYGFPGDNLPGDRKDEQNEQELQRSMMACKAAYQRTPDDSRACLNLAHAYLDMATHCEYAAVKFLHKAKGLNPGIAEIYRLFGNIYDQKRDNEDLSVAEDMYKKAISLDAVDTESYDALSLLFERQGRLKEAIHYLEKRLEVEPEKYLLENLSRLYEKAGFSDKANEVFIRALEIDEVDEEIRHMKRIIDNAPPREKIYARTVLAECYKKKGMIKNAIEELEEIVHMCPDNNVARKKLKELKDRREA